MFKELVLAEKPSVGREIAKVLGCNKNNNGYIEGGQYIVTWAFGHLMELANPSYYGEKYRRWSLENLPIIPPVLQELPIESTIEQYNTVLSLIEREDVSTIIIATDAGREGELVARSVIKASNSSKPIKRLWISSQTETSIKEGFANLKEGSLYENLYKAAVCRSAADWYVGINVSRALTSFYDAKLSSGRVQTPTLALITEREKERQKFLGSFYWSVSASFETFKASWKNSEGTNSIATEKEKEAIVKELENQNAIVTSIESVELKAEPPLAYDLTELQKEANLYLNFSAKETLDTLQRLYEVHKIVTYPRTDSRYITNDIVATLKNRLMALEETDFGQIAKLYAINGFRKEMDHFVKESGVTDHHALLPTEQKVSLNRLSEKERLLFNLIAKRFLEVLSEDHIYTNTKVDLEVKNQLLSATFRKTLQNGFKDISLISQTGFEEEEETLSGDFNHRVGDSLSIIKVNSRKHATRAPERYSEGTLLNAMENARRFVEDKELKKSLKGGLGTAATRSEIIEKLIQNKYIERDGRYLIPTAVGFEVVRLSPAELTVAELTALWEQRLAAIEEGEEEPQMFLDDIKETTKRLVREIKNSTKRYSEVFDESKKCPACSFALLKYKDEENQIHYKCQRLSCGYEEAVIRSVKPSKVLNATTKSVDGKKRVVVVKKGTKEAPTYTETTKVITPSRYRKPNEHNHKVKESDTTTFADLIAASENRNKRGS